MRNTNPIDALFPKVRQNILSATYSQPEKWWFMSELATFIETTPSSLQRELATLVDSGILRSRRDGNRLYFQAETDSPIFVPLRDLISQTLGIVGEIKESISQFAEKIDFAFIYGSVARGEEHTLSDVDIMVVGSIGLAELSPPLRELGRKFNREINATCYRVEEFQKKLETQSHFLTNVIGNEKIYLIGGEDELESIISKSDNTNAHN
jgi:predicted nucleotidyltransferase